MSGKRIGNRIRQEREKLNFSREKFAEIVNLSPNFLGQIERGEASMSLETLIKISKNLRISLDYIIFGSSRDNSCTSDNELLDLIKKCSKKEKEFAVKLLKELLPYIKK